MFVGDYMDAFVDIRVRVNLLFVVVMHILFVAGILDSYRVAADGVCVVPFP